MTQKATPRQGRQHSLLAPYRVLDLTGGGPGARLLADLGADVIRAEPPFGSVTRCRGPGHQLLSAANEGLAFLLSQRTEGRDS